SGSSHAPHARRSYAELGLAAAVAALHVNEREGEVGIGLLLARCGEERALLGRFAAALLRDFEPALHHLRALEQCLDLCELPARQRAHRAGHAVLTVDPLDQVLDLGELEPGALR